MAKKSVTTAVFNVTVTLPPGMNLKDMQDYVRDAVKSYKGGMDPQDPTFHLDPDTVRVALSSKVTKYG